MTYDLCHGGHMVAEYPLLHSSCRWVMDSPAPVEMYDICWFVFVLGWLKPPAAHQWANAGMAMDKRAHAHAHALHQAGSEKKAGHECSMSDHALFCKRLSRLCLNRAFRWLRDHMGSNPCHPHACPQIPCLRHKMIRQSTLFVVLSLAFVLDAAGEAHPPLEAQVAEAVAGLQAFLSLLWMMG